MIISRQHSRHHSLVRNNYLHDLEANETAVVSTIGDMALFFLAPVFIELFKNLLQYALDETLMVLIES